ncbi:aldose epimerase family protein [Flavobacterium sp. RSB2_4_14]|uniref:aldose epimerase family protein n=1 Tax=Flavobacterium sp. RSB2_4_14 TaxID=3447665 RepID=UPI003F2B764E
MDKNHFLQIEPTIIKKSFGFMPDGNEIFCYTLSNKNGMELSVINYGTTITSLKIPISDEKKIDVVLGFKKLEDYINSFNLPSAPYFGSVVGRYAGRINDASFILNGKKIVLTKNHNSHQLHGGLMGFGRKFWKVIASTSVDNPSITLEYTSKNKEENFPGEVIVKVTYTITEANELMVSFLATTSEDTIINLTQHSYFNLDGHDNTIGNQELFVNSSKILNTTEENIPTGEFIALKKHPFDFKIQKKCPQKIDTTFILENTNTLAASLFSEKNKLKMSVFTNQPAVHIYIGGNCFNQIKGKENTEYHPFSGICFETQNFPDAPNHMHFPNAILKKGEEYLHQTIFKFENL